MMKNHLTKVPPLIVINAITKHKNPILLKNADTVSRNRILIGLGNQP